MRAKIGDVVIDRSYNKKGNLAIVVGEGISQPILINHKGGITMDKLRDYFAVWDELEVIGHIDFEKVWEEALRINEPNSSENPNNCETCRHWWKSEEVCLLDDCQYEPEFEPQTDGYMTAEQTEDYRKMLNKAEHRAYGNIDNEPQTDCAWGKGEE